MDTTRILSLIDQIHEQGKALSEVENKIDELSAELNGINSAIDVLLFEIYSEIPDERHDI